MAAGPHRYVGRWIKVSARLGNGLRAGQSPRATTATYRHEQELGYEQART